MYPFLKSHILHTNTHVIRCRFENRCSTSSHLGLKVVVRIQNVVNPGLVQCMHNIFCEEKIHEFCFFFVCEMAIARNMIARANKNGKQDNFLARTQTPDWEKKYYVNASGTHAITKLNNSSFYYLLCNGGTIVPETSSSAVDLILFLLPSLKWKSVCFHYQKD